MRSNDALRSAQPMQRCQLEYRLLVPDVFVPQARHHELEVWRFDAVAAIVGIARVQLLNRTTTMLADDDLANLDFVQHRIDEGRLDAYCIGGSGIELVITTDWLLN